MNMNKLSILFFILSLSISISGCQILYGAALAVECGTRPDLEIHPEVLPVAVVGQPYRVEIMATKNETPIAAISIESGQLPAGLEYVYVHESLHEQTATIEGTPTETGEFTFSMEAWALGTMCAGQSGSREYTLRVVDIE